MKKRVLQFIPSFHQGGSERQAVAMTRMLKGDGTFDVFAATLNATGVLASEVEAIGLAEVPEFAITSFYSPGFAMKARACAGYLKANGIDLIHTYDFYTNVFGMAAALLAGTEVKITSKRETGGMRSTAQEYVERIAFGRADAVVVNSDAVGRFVAEWSFDEARIRTIYNGIKADEFQSLNGKAAAIVDKLDLQAGRRFITLVANLRHEVKNVPMLLRAASQVVEQVPDAHFVIAGEGELESSLKTQCHELGIADRVTFIGRCSDVPALLSASYACVLTSSAEGFSNSILEYMAAGKPVIATDVGGAREAIIDGETGFVVASDDDHALAQKLLGLLGDDGLAKRMGAAGLDRVRRDFTETIQLQKTLDLYNSLLAK